MVTMGYSKKVYILFFSIFILKVSCISDDEINEFATHLQDDIKKAQNGKLATDNSKFKPDKDEEPEDFGEYDFIIVGSGATGSTLAYRLSEEKKFKILLLEAGGFPDNFTSVPFTIDLSHFTKFNWGYKSVPQKYSCLGMNNAECIIPRGQGLGGTTLINGLMYVRGYPTDYIKWANMGNPGWSYKDVLPLFKKTEEMVKNNPEAQVYWPVHGKNGPLHTEYYPTTDPQLTGWYNAQKSLGFSFSDPNGPWQIGYGPKPVQIKHGRRFDCGTAFVLPVLDRQNLKVQTHSLVTKILLEKSSAEGVLFSYNRKIYKAKAKREVIVSGGAINSPQLLMLSGIGPEHHLTEKNIKVIKNLPVGKTFKEHPAYYGLVFSSNYSEPVKTFNDYVRDLLVNEKGPLTVPGSFKGMAFYKSKYEKLPTTPDMEFLFTGANCSTPFMKKGFNLKEETYNAIYAQVEPKSCFQIIPVALHVKSNGFVRLETDSPYDFPLINPNHLAEKIDEDTLYEGIKQILKWIETKPFQKINAKLGVEPLPACKKHEFKSKDYWYCTLGQITYNMYHPVGSNPMGPNPKTSVVDHELKVHGIKNLRVADASVFPFTLSGHPVAPCVMIGDKLAELLKSYYK
ncbi:unnamed protein product [Brassicogethes aeneus]|uniref:Glucose-methanol-choline oxidoreductase N-terminal domain-containing protein n=1 Tax=Brassicogethes aeneus TaxID=1431903 RepID=A0A9P0ARK8_BRAAE|nr:unnamed protein product [Brassicogethes aeneus]